MNRTRIAAGVAGAIAATVCLVGVFVPDAWGHANIVNMSETCSVGQQVVTVTVMNDYNLTETATVASATVDGSSVPASDLTPSSVPIAASPSEPYQEGTFSWVFTGSSTPTISVKIHGHWSDGFTTNDLGGPITLVGGCETPTTTTTSTTTTTVPATTTTTEAPATTTTTGSPSSTTTSTTGPKPPGSATTLPKPPSPTTPPPTVPLAGQPPASGPTPPSFAAPAPITSIPPSPTTTTVPSPGTVPLAFTGFDPIPALLTGLLFLVLGAVAVVVYRVRRRPSERSGR